MENEFYAYGVKSGDTGLRHRQECYSGSKPWNECFCEEDDWKEITTNQRNKKGKL